MFKKLAKRVRDDNERGARRAVLEDLFYDFNKTRAQIYWLNFVRGLFFGVGSILGGTLVIALVLWILSLFTGIPGGIGDFIEQIRHTVEQGPSQP